MRRRTRLSGSVVSVVCLAIGMGASAMSLTLADATVLRPFGLPRAADLVVLWESDPARPADLLEVSLPNFHDWERGATAFASMAAFGSSNWPAIARAGGDSFAIAPRAVSRRFFETLGRAPLLGRDFTPDDLVLSNAPPAMLSHAFWTSRFGADPGVIGRSIAIDNESHRIVGVMPRGFAFPDAPDVWISVERALQTAFAADGLIEEQQRAIGVLLAVGRLAPGVSAERARDELNRIESALWRALKPKQKPLVAVLTPFTDVVLGRLGARVWIALAMTVAVLLFACANVAALRVATLRNRLAELSARLCLGATRATLARELLRETVPLIVTAAIAAVLIAGAIEAWLRQVPAVAASGIDLAQVRAVPLAAIGVSAVIAWLLVSVAPAVSVVQRVSPADLTLGSRTVARGSRTTSALLMLQAALALCLVAMAGGAFRTFARLAATDVGFSTSRVTTIDTSIPGWKYQTDDARSRLDKALLDALAALPGATAVAGVSVRPFRFGEIADGMPVRRPEDVSTQPSSAVAAARVVITPRYFTAMDIEVVEGRGFTEFDASASPPSVVVSRSLARTLWGTASATGNALEFLTLRRGWQRALVIGVAADVRSRLLDRAALEVYVSHGTGGLPLGSFVVRHEARSEMSDAELRAALQAVDPDVAVERVQTTRAVVDRVLAPSRLLSTAMTMLGGTGLVLLTLGIFGAAATILGAARREVAIRQAIGATPFKAARAPLRALLAALAAGTMAGAVTAPAGVALLAAMGVADDGGLLVASSGAAALVIGAAGLAIGLNIRRATARSPAELLRSE